MRPSLWVNSEQYVAFLFNILRLFVNKTFTLTMGKIDTLLKSLFQGFPTLVVAFV